MQVVAIVRGWGVRVHETLNTTSIAPLELVVVLYNIHVLR